MLKVIDLFSGAGGLSLGAARAGFKLTAAAEIDKNAIETHSLNFPNTSHIDTPVQELSARKIYDAAKLKDGEISGVIGGPPCQGFSTMGHGDIEDVRNQLFGHFFRLVSEISPAFFLAENVPGILNPKYDSIRKEAFENLNDKFVCLDPIVVKANEYGAPTTRTRVFFIGYNPKLIGDLNPTIFKPIANQPKTNVSKALAGLNSEIDTNWRDINSEWQKCFELEESDFSKLVTGRIPKGVGDPSTIERYKLHNEVSGCMGTIHSAEIESRYKNLKYGEVDPISKSRKLDPNGFCPTLRAGTGSDKGSYQAVRPIHFEKPRVITPREAARLQGFPDWFKFHPTKWHSFRQIGNSVSPIVSEFLLQKIHNQLK